MDAQHKLELDMLDNNLRSVRIELSNYKISLYNQFFNRNPSFELIQLWANEDQNYLLELEDNLNDNEILTFKEGIAEINMLNKEIALRRA